MEHGLAGWAVSPQRGPTARLGRGVELSPAPAVAALDLGRSKSVLEAEQQKKRKKCPKGREGSCWGWAEGSAQLMPSQPVWGSSSPAWSWECRAEGGAEPCLTGSEPTRSVQPQQRTKAGMKPRKSEAVTFAKPCQGPQSWDSFGDIRAPGLAPARAPEPSQLPRDGDLGNLQPQGCLVVQRSWRKLCPAVFLGFSRI